MANNNASGQYKNRNNLGGNINAGGGSANEGVNGVGGNAVASNLNDICNFLQPTNMNAALNLQPGACSYDHLVDMIRGLDLHDDGIQMNQKMKAISADFCVVVRDENMLCECMDYINDKALADGETALKFAMLFSSHNFDQLAMKDIKIRSAMLKVLEANYLNADAYRIHDKDRLYNSITLLGEYYNRVRLADQSPITILGESLLNLLMREVSALEPINVKLAKLILSQITLNGDIIRVKHKNELTQLLYHIRRNLIEQPGMSSTVKALLLMTLDLYYSNFTNLGTQLEQMYTKYLVQDVEDEGNNNSNNANNGNVCLTTNQTLTAPAPPSVYAPPVMEQQQTQLLEQQQQQQQQQALSPPINKTHAPTPPINSPLTKNNEMSPTNTSFENGGDAEVGGANNSFESLSTKKWSEQVCEDSLYESEFENGLNSYEQDNIINDGSAMGGMLDSGVQGRLSNGRRGGGGGGDLLNTSSDSRYNDDDSSSRNARRSQKPRNSPRPLKQQQRGGGGGNEKDNQLPPNEEEQDETKPLPRWRAPRFNRENDFQQQNTDRPQHNQQHQRRYSASFDEDVRSDGGSIRLYSINDRLRHSQEKMERSGSQYNSIANSNWDRQSQHGGDDRSERSYISNYERGNNYRRGNRHNNYNHNNNRNNYDKPPRFLKQQQQQQQHHNQHQQQNQNHQHHKDTTNIHSNSWRQSRSNSMNSNYHDEHDHRQSAASYRSNGPESNSRSSSRARTLPRPSKSRQFEEEDDGTKIIDGTATYPRRSSQSPSTHRQHQQQQQRSRKLNARYSSQSSLASEASSTLDRRHHQRHRNFNRQSQQQQQRPQQRQEREERKELWSDDINVQHEDNTWHNEDADAANADESELVRNARQTAKYMNYLASKK